MGKLCAPSRYGIQTEKNKNTAGKGKFDRIILEIQKALQGSQRSLGRAI